MSLIARYNPHDLPEDVVTRLATGRDAVRDRILDDITRNLAHPAAPNQHLLIVGPRGMGKSFLLRLVQIAVDRRAAAGEPLGFALLPEEQHNITAPHLLLDEIRRTFLGEPATEVRVRWFAGGAAEWDAARARLDEALDARFGPGRGLLVAAVENLDRLMDSVFKDAEDASLLRALLQTHPRFMLLATAVTSQVQRGYDDRLFQAFDVVDLEPWSTEDCCAYFGRRDALPGADKTSDSAKQRALALFIGGNPRLAVLLGDVLHTRDALGAAATLDALTDELTPYYQDRVDRLGLRARGLLDELLRGGEPCSQTELAQRVGARAQADIARAFAELQRDRIVTGSPAPDGRETLYRVADRVFAHYYRRRFILHGTSVSPLAAIAEFLAAFYTWQEQQAEAVRLLAGGRPAEARLLADLARRDAATAYRWVRPDDPASLRRNAERLSKIATRLVPEVTPELGHCLADIAGGRAEQAAAEAARQRDRAERPAARALWTAVVAQCDQVLMLLSTAIDAWSAALAAADQAGDPALRAFCLACRAWCQGATGAHELAVADARAAAELADAAGDTEIGALARRVAAWNLTQLSRHDAALAAAEEAALLAAAAGDILGQAVARQYTASDLGHLGRHEAALTTAEDAAQLAKIAGDIGGQAVAHRYAAWSLGQLGRHEAALGAAEDAARLAAAAGDLREQAVARRYAAWSLDELGRHEAAVAAAEDAARLAEAAGDSLEQAVAHRYAAWSLGQLGRHEEAVAVAEDAARLAEIAGDLRGQAEARRCAAWNLGQLGRHEEAVAAAEDAARLAEAAGGIGEQALARALVAEYLILMRRIPEAMDALAETLQIRGSIPNHQAMFREDFLWNLQPQIGFLGQECLDVWRRDGRAAAFAVASRLLSIVAEQIGMTAAPLVEQQWFAATIKALAGALVREIDDPGLLRDLAGTIETGPGANRPPMNLIRELFRGAAAFHEAGRDPAALARLDPDIAAALGQLLGIATTTEPPKKRRRRPTRSKA